MLQIGKCELGWTSRGSNLPLPRRRPPAIASGHFYHFAILMDSIRLQLRPHKPDQQRPRHHHPQGLQWGPEIIQDQGLWWEIRSFQDRFDQVLNSGPASSGNPQVLLSFKSGDVPPSLAFHGWHIEERVGSGGVAQSARLGACVICSLS